MKYFVNIKKDINNFILTEALPMEEAYKIISDYVLDNISSEIHQKFNIEIIPETELGGGEK